MPVIVVTLLKKFGPYIIVFLLGWVIGYSTAKEEHIEYVATLKQQTKTLFQQAEAKNSDIKNTLNESARIIEEQSHEHQKTIENITKRNRELLSDRMRNTDSCPSTLPNDSATTESSNGASTGYWMVQRAVAERIIDRHDKADKVTKTAIACQAYVKSIQEKFNEHQVGTSQH